ncbi:MAG: pilus assembly protein [Candidatus Dormibacteraeota bacterium]|nr:pilus assembly protein [Candidatus Dormibacteraeota bacterium]
MRTGERSQAMTEFAMVAPVLLLLTFGILDFGRALYYYSAAGNAAREAARVATRASSPMPADSDVSSAGAIHFPGATISVPGGCANGPIPSTPPSAGTAWLFITEPNPVAGSAAQLNPPANAPGGETPAGASGGCSAVNPAIGNQQLTVTVIYNYAPVTPLISTLVSGHIVFSLQVMVRTEY